MAALFDGGGFYNASGGALPWGSGGADAFRGLNGGDPAGALADNYAKGYSDVLDMNKSNYNNILEGYKGALSSQQAAQASLGAGYNQLYNDTMGKISGIGGVQSQAIIDQYRAEQGRQNQQLINRGLGNTTVQSAVDRGVNYDRTKALNQNAENMAGLQARYMSQLGLAGLQNQQQSYMANTGQVNRQLDWMNSVNAKYPDAGLYAGLASKYGGGGRTGGAMAGNPGTPGLGYMPRPFYGDQGGSGVSPGYGGGGGYSWVAAQNAARGDGSYPKFSDGYGSTVADGAGGDWASWGPDNAAGLAVGAGLTGSVWGMDELSDYGGGGDF